MSRFVPILLLAVLATSTGCISLFEKVVLHRDGSGVWEIRLDLSEALGMGGAFGDDEFGEEAGVFGGRDLERTDTLIRYADLPASTREAFRHPELSARGQGRIRIDEATGDFFVEFRFPFQEVGEIHRFQQDAFAGLAGVGGEEVRRGLEDEELGTLVPDGDRQEFFLERKTLSRRSGYMGPEEGAVDDNYRDMLGMFFADAAWRVEYVLPGKVKKLSREDYDIGAGKRTVTGRELLPGLLGGATFLDVEIKYK